MKRVILYTVVGVLVVASVLLSARPVRQRFGDLRSDIATINADTGEVMASATYQRFQARREAVEKMRAALLALARAESLFVADSGRPTTSPFYGRYAFANDRSNLGPTIEIRRDRWVARINNIHTTMTCTLTAMLDSVSGQYRPGAPVCGGWTPEESVAAVATTGSQTRAPQPRVIDRISSAEPVNNTPPPLPWIQKGVCPGGHCRFGQWTACSTIVVTQDKRIDSPVGFTLRPGEEFTALTGDVHVESAGLVGFRSTFNTVIEKQDAAGPVVTIIQFSRADSLYPLVEVADRVIAWWFRGAADTGTDFWRPDPAVYRPDALKASVLIRSATETWWIRIRNARGQEGWAVYDFEKISTTTSRDDAATCQTETG